MSRVIFSLCLLCCIAGCTSRIAPETAYVVAYVSKDGPRRPIVALVPLIDSTLPHLSWNLSDELTAGIERRLDKKDIFYLARPARMRQIARTLSPAQNPFGTDPSWMKEAFPRDEFVVFMELLEHDEVPLSPGDAPAELNIAVRLRVLDLRGQKVRVVLQEVVRESHYIPKPFTRAHFAPATWGSDTYSITPLGLAHAQLSKEIAGRIEDYILLVAPVPGEKSSDG